MKIDGTTIPQLNISVGSPKPISDVFSDITPTTIGASVEKTSGAPGNLDALKSLYSDKELKKIGIIDCQTCSERTYVDSSDDPGVSFKTPTQVDPSQAATAVMSHELEHVSNEQADARSDGREIVSQSVSIHTSRCPECGVSYVSGGTTKTVSKKKSDYGLSNEMTKGLKIDNKI